MEKFILSQIPIEELIEKIANKVLNAKTVSSQKQDQKKFLTLNELCKEYSFAKPTIYSLTAKMGIPHIKKGKKLMFEREKIEEWLRQSRRKTKSEIENEHNSQYN